MAEETRQAMKNQGVRVLLTALFAVLLGAFWVTSPAWGYLIFLKDGTQLSTEGEYRVDGDKAHVTLLNGVEAVLDLAEIDIAKTEEVNRDNYGRARLIETRQVIELKTNKAAAERETLGQLVQRTGGKLALPSNKPPATLVRVAGDPADFAATVAGFVDFRKLRREPYPQEQLATELLSYLRDQDLERLGIYQGSRPNFMLVDIGTDTEATVFKAMRDCANALVQLREGTASSLAGLEILMTASNGARGGQFTLTPELANVLLSGTLKPEAFFLRYVEF